MEIDTSDPEVSDGKSLKWEEATRARLMLKQDSGRAHFLTRVEHDYQRLEPGNFNDTHWTLDAMVCSLERTPNAMRRTHPLLYLLVTMKRRNAQKTLTTFLSR
jgi:hypothetical protein